MIDIANHKHSGQTTGEPDGRQRRIRRIRYLTAALAGAAALPYLMLKVAWLAGSSVGVTSRSFLHSSGIESLNALTAGMDAVALVLVLVFVTPIGRRMPGWLILFPMWVGTGFLGPIALAGPADAVYSAISGQGVVSAHGALRPWVYHLVYTGFACEGVFLLATFVLYAAERWPAAFTGAGPAGETAWLRRLLARAAGALALAAGGAHLAWAAGVQAGLPARIARAEVASTHLTEAAFGVFALAGAAGLIVLLRRSAGRGRVIVPLVLAWAGTASMFAWGFWMTLNTLGGTVLAQGTGAGSGPLNLVYLAELLAGLLAGTLLAFQLAGTGSGTIKACEACGQRCAR